MSFRFPFTILLGLMCFTSFAQGPKRDSVRVIDPRTFPLDSSVADLDEVYTRPDGTNKKHRMRDVRKYIYANLSSAFTVNQYTGAATLSNDIVAWAKLSAAARDSIITGKKKVRLSAVKPASSTYLADMVVDTAGVDTIYFWNNGLYVRFVTSDPPISLLKIKELIPALGLAANESVTNYTHTSVNATTYKFSTAPLGSPSTEYGGWLANGTSGDSIRVSAPFWVVIGDSQAEGHPATHGRLHSPVNLAKADVTGQLSYHLRELTKFRWFNHGIGGQTSTQILNRFDRDALGRTYDAGDGLPTKTLSGKPMGIVVVAGINDFYSGISTTTTKSNLTQIAIKCQLEGIYCVMLNIPGDEVINETQSKQIDEVNQWLKDGALNTYSVVVVDYNTWWRDPNFNDNAHAGSLIVDDIHPSAVGYDSLAHYIFREAKLPVLTKVIVYNQVSPSTPITGFSRPNSIRVGGATTYSLANAIDSFVVTTPIVTDSVWIRILSSTNVSGTTYSGFSHILWVLDNGERGEKLEKNGSKINDLLYPYIIINPKDNPNHPILNNRPIERTYSTSFGNYYTAENVTVGTSPYTHSGKGGFIIQLPDLFNSFFGIVELEFSGANTIPISTIKLSFNNNVCGLLYEGYFAGTKPYVRVVGTAGGAVGDYYIVVGDSTITWSYTLCRVKQITSFFGFIDPVLSNTLITFSTTPRIFAASKANTLPLIDYSAEVPDLGIPTIAIHANAGTTASAAISGNNTSGILTITSSGTGQAIGQQATITFSKAISPTPISVTLTPVGSTGTSINAYIVDASLSTSLWRIGFNTVPVSGTTYKFYYQVKQ